MRRTYINYPAEDTYVTYLSDLAELSWCPDDRFGWTFARVFQNFLLDVVDVIRR